MITMLKQTISISSCLKATVAVLFLKANLNSVTSENNLSDYAEEFLTALTFSGSDRIIIN